MPDVLIVGGGVIGCAVAYQLAKAGVGVAVLERGELGVKTGRGFYEWSQERIAQVRTRRARALARWFRDGQEGWA